MAESEGRIGRLEQAMAMMEDAGFAAEALALSACCTTTRAAHGSGRKRLQLRWEKLITPRDFQLLLAVCQRFTALSSVHIELAWPLDLPEVEAALAPLAGRLSELSLAVADPFDARHLMLLLPRRFLQGWLDDRAFKYGITQVQGSRRLELVRQQVLMAGPAGGWRRGAAPSVHAPDGLVPTKATELCKYFRSGRGCQRGSACVYAHVLPSTDLAADLIAHHLPTPTQQAQLMQEAAEAVAALAADRATPTGGQAIAAGRLVAGLPLRAAASSVAGPAAPTALPSAAAPPAVDSNGGEGGAAGSSSGAASTAAKAFEIKAAAARARNKARQDAGLKAGTWKAVKIVGTMERPYDEDDEDDDGDYDPEYSYRYINRHMLPPRPMVLCGILVEPPVARYPIVDVPNLLKRDSYQRVMGNLPVGTSSAGARDSTTAATRAGGSAGGSAAGAPSAADTKAQDTAELWRVKAASRCCYPWLRCLESIITTHGPYLRVLRLVDVDRTWTVPFPPLLEVAVAQQLVEQQKRAAADLCPPASPCPAARAAPDEEQAGTGQHHTRPAISADVPAALPAPAPAEQLPVVSYSTKLSSPTGTVKGAAWRVLVKAEVACALTGVPRVGLHGEDLVLAVQPADALPAAMHALSAEAGADGGPAGSTIPAADRVDAGTTAAHAAGTPLVARIPLPAAVVPALHLASKACKAQWDGTTLQVRLPLSAGWVPSPAAGGDWKEPKPPKKHRKPLLGAQGERILAAAAEQLASTAQADVTTGGGSGGATTAATADPEPTSMKAAGTSGAAACADGAASAAAATADVASSPCPSLPIKTPVTGVAEAVPVTSPDILTGVKQWVQVRDDRMGEKADAAATSPKEVTVGSSSRSTMGSSGPGLAVAKEVAELLVAQHSWSLLPSLGSCPNLARLELVGPSSTLAVGGLGPAAAGSTTAGVNDEVTVAGGGAAAHRQLLCGTAMAIQFPPHAASPVRAQRAYTAEMFAAMGIDDDDDEREVGQEDGGAEDVGMAAGHGSLARRMLMASPRRQPLLLGLAGLTRLTLILPPPPPGALQATLPSPLSTLSLVVPGLQELGLVQQHLSDRAGREGLGTVDASALQLVRAAGPDFTAAVRGLTHLSSLTLVGGTLCALPKAALASLRLYHTRVPDVLSAEAAAHVPLAAAITVPARGYGGGRGGGPGGYAARARGPARASTTAKAADASGQTIPDVSGMVSLCDALALSVHSLKVLALVTVHAVTPEGTATGDAGAMPPLLLASGFERLCSILGRACFLTDLEFSPSVRAMNRLDEGMVERPDVRRQAVATAACLSLGPLLADAAPAWQCLTSLIVCPRIHAATCGVTHEFLGRQREEIVDRLTLPALTFQDRLETWDSGAEDGGTAAADAAAGGSVSSIVSSGATTSGSSHLLHQPSLVSSYLALPRLRTLILAATAVPEAVGAAPSCARSTDGPTGDRTVPGQPLVHAELLITGVYRPLDRSGRPEQRVTTTVERTQENPFPLLPPASPTTTALACAQLARRCGQGTRKLILMAPGAATTWLLARDVQCLVPAVAGGAVVRLSSDVSVRDFSGLKPFGPDDPRHSMLHRTSARTGRTLEEEYFRRKAARAGIAEAGYEAAAASKAQLIAALKAAVTTLAAAVPPHAWRAAPAVPPVGTQFASSASRLAVGGQGTSDQSGWKVVAAPDSRANADPVSGPPRTTPPPVQRVALYLLEARDDTSCSFSLHMVVKEPQGGARLLRYDAAGSVELTSTNKYYASPTLRASEGAASLHCPPSEWVGFVDEKGSMVPVGPCLSWPRQPWQADAPL